MESQRWSRSESDDESIVKSSQPPPYDVGLASCSYDRTTENVCDESIVKSSQPPPNYNGLVLVSSYYRSAKNVYHSIPIWDDETKTFIHTDENVSAVKFARRCRDFSAPDMLLNGLTKPTNQYFQAKINGRLVDYTAMSVLTLDEGKKLLIEYARARWKLPMKVARKCIIKNTEYDVAFWYRLLTQIEKRGMENRTKPYRGEKLSTYRPRSASDCTIDRPKSFQERKCYFVVPSTEKVITCTLCDGEGKGRCKACYGSGQKMCSRCHGFGQEPMSERQCSKCGDGFETCRDCHGAGVGKCVDCEGRGKVISYQRLKVNWTVTEYVYIDPIDGVPREHLTRAKGPLIHEDVCDGHLEPITEENLFHSKIVEDSARQIARTRVVGDTVCKQSQTVHLILVQRFNCQYKGKEFSFRTIGMEREVYAPYYPNRRFKFLDFFTGKR